MNKEIQSPSFFPFSAIVGQEDLRLALILSAIAPRIGGVIARGEKGTAKTTTVRAFSRLLGSAPLVNLPLGVTEDRVVGSLDIETVLTTGKAQFQPGLLSAADGGVLYVDEVNLLADHIVDVLLDAAATGMVTIERDSISHTESARFVLVGTMNPEEGELRPQLLDRFGLSVDIAGPADVRERAEIMRRRLAYENDPQGFVRQWQEKDEEIAVRIAQAKDVVDEISLSDAQLERIAYICAEFGVEGLRGDLVIARTAMAHAAWQQRGSVNEEDINVAARLALPHRRRQNPFDEPGVSEQELENIMERSKEQHNHQDHSQPEPTDAADHKHLGNNSMRPQHNPDDAHVSQDGKVGSADSGAPFRYPNTQT
ncbi:ATP-binding protein [Corynebacterium sp. sy039]|uniref:ATP-binding protein n=1 Tax=Corynebacterium sp. sy039 TaxID=2599641 RepID=UPI0011B6E366|nr:AAA family ATPase [Corynebacterium sp. sy039]QDZ42809.1 magnesium chelatase [Corynebacterium sp. sy039]